MIIFATYSIECPQGNTQNFYQSINFMKYIKVTKEESSSVVLSSNEAFYKAQGYTISEPSKAEIEASFPEEKKETTKVDSSAKKALEEAQKALEAANQEIEKLSKK